MNLLATPARRKLLFATLYFSEGAPIGFLWWALPTQLRAAGVPIHEVATLLSLLVLPWALKFFWAPLVDVLRSDRWGLKSWIISTQTLMGATLLPLLTLNLHDQFSLVLPLLLIHAFCAATQDVSIDALCIAVTNAKERGAINGWMQAGMLTGRAALGGGALVLWEHFGVEAVILLLTASVWAGMALLFCSREPAGNASQHLAGQERLAKFVRTLKRTGTKRTTWVGILFAAIGGAGYEAVGAVAGPFMVDRGMTSEEVGYFFAFPSIACMLAGSLLGGYLSDRMRRTVAVGLSLGFVATVILILAATDGAADGLSSAATVFLLSLLYLSIGLFTASSYAMFMDLTDPLLGATQFSAFMGMTNVCESWSAFAVGRLVLASGYPLAFAVMALVSLFSLPLLRLLGSSLPSGVVEETPSRGHS